MKDKQYLVTEEEIRNLLLKYENWDNPEWYTENIASYVGNFFATKQPVEVLDRKERAREIYKKIEKYIECVDGEKLIKGRQYIIFTDRESVPISKLSLELAELILPQKPTDENTEAYCENLQRENQYLRDKLSTEGKVIARGELFTDEESWLNSFIENGNSIIRLDALCEKIDKDYAGQNIEIKILHIDK